jgi:hypothetical protein
MSSFIIGNRGRHDHQPSQDRGKTRQTLSEAEYAEAYLLPHFW